MRINWRVRLANRQFWASAVPALALVAESVAALFGFRIDLTTLTGQLLTVINAVFAFLVILGVVVDPTTEGVGDSNRAMSYEEPWHDSTLKDA